jgi:hypothetical protein
MEKKNPFVPTKQYLVSLKDVNDSYMSYRLGEENVEINSRCVTYITLDDNTYVFTDDITGKPLRISNRLTIYFFALDC